MAARSLKLSGGSIASIFSTDLFGGDEKHRTNKKRGANKEEPHR